MATIPLLFGGVAKAQNVSEDASAASSPAALETVLVTGSRVLGRTVQDSPVPIDVLNAAELDRTNKADLIDIMNAAIPSWNTPLRPRPTGLFSMVRTAQLRGLSANHTLVLVNGKRWHNTAFVNAGGLTGQSPVDLSLIPSGVIERIEVLRDGASAIYGSDALAGVVNIITDNSAEGVDFSYRWSEYFKGEGRDHVFKGSGGFGWGDNGHVRVSGQLNDSEPTSMNSAVPAEYLYYFPFDANGNPVMPVTATGRPDETNGYLLPPGSTPDPRELTRDNYAQKIIGRHETELQTVSVDAGKEFGNAEFYSFANYSERTTWAPQHYRPAYRDLTVRAIYPDGFTPINVLDEVDFGSIFGVRGSVGAWNWDLSTGYGQDTIKIYTENTDNPTYGVNSKTNFYIGEMQNGASTTNLDLQRAFDVSWLDEPLQLTVGTEYRRETYERSEGEPESYSDGGFLVLDGPNTGRTLRGKAGSSGIQGFEPVDNVDTSRSNRSVYVDLSLNPLTAWVVDLAARYENYSDFGETTTRRLSTRYDFSDRVALRFTASNGFQAPAVSSPTYQFTSTHPTSGTSHTLANVSPEAVALGAQPLEPENSRNYTLGVVFSPWRDLNVAIDVYQISVTGRMASSTTFGQATYPGSGALIVAAGLPITDRVNYLINAGDTESEGVDITLEKAFDLGELGNLQLTVAANYNRAEVVALAPTPPVLAQYGIPLFSQGSINELTNLAPKSKELLSANWARDKWGVLLRLTHYGDIDRFGSPDVVATDGPYAGMTEIPYNIGATWLTDLEFDFNVNDNWGVSFAASNLFDEKPDTLPQPLVPTNQYYVYAHNGPLTGDGGFYSATFRYRF